MKNREIVKALGLFSQIGVTVVACILVGVFLGWWLDRLLGTAPWLLLLCSFLGVGAAFKMLFELMSKLDGQSVCGKDKRDK